MTPTAAAPTAAAPTAAAPTAAAPTAASPGSSPKLDALEARVVADLNELRADRGLPALTVQGDLQDKARLWAAGMAAGGRVWHSHLDEGITSDWQVLGENVGMGPSVDDLFRAFEASPAHMANLVRPDWDRVGVGVVVDSDGTLFVAQEFERLR